MERFIERWKSGREGRMNREEYKTDGSRGKRRRQAGRLRLVRPLMMIIGGDWSLGPCGSLVLAHAESPQPNNTDSQ